MVIYQTYFSTFAFSHANHLPKKLLSTRICFGKHYLRGVFFFLSDSEVCQIFMYCGMPFPLTCVVISNSDKIHLSQWEKSLKQTLALGSVVVQVRGRRMEGLLVTREPQWKIQNSLTSTGLLSISSPTSLLQVAPSQTVTLHSFGSLEKMGP